MKNIASIGLLALASALVLTACDKAGDAPEATTAKAQTAKWPESLVLVGDGFPNSGDDRRKIGESAETVNYLDDSATLAGCLSEDDAKKLGGKIVGTVDGVTLVIRPRLRIGRAG